MSKPFTKHTLWEAFPALAMEITKNSRDSTLSSEDDWSGPPWSQVCLPEKNGEGGMSHGTWRGEGIVQYKA